MYKVIDVGSWSSMDIGPVQAIKVARNGMGAHDRYDLFQKRAASHEFERMLARDSLKPGDIPIHLVALGAYEKYGMNRNGDAFKEQWCLHCHDSFVKHAYYYLNHRNKDPKKSYGLVKLSTYNRPMSRVELLVIANGTKEAAERNGGLVLPDNILKKLANNDPVEVSMSCILDPQAPVLTHRGYVPIVDVKPGDKVLTHKGRWRTVTELRRRKYTGEVVKWRMQGIPYEVELTADHPMLSAKLAEKAAAAVSKSAFQEWMTKPKKAQYDWLGAGLLGPSDRVQACVVSEGIPGEAVIDNEELAEILGTYMAEGSVTYNGEKPAATQFTIHGDDWATHNLTAVAHHHWPELTATIEPKTNSPVAFTLTMSSTSLATYLATVVGTNSHTKKVPLGLYGAKSSVKHAFLGRWIDGDGWIDKGGAHISSVNFTALLSARDLVLSLGYECVIARIEHTETRENGYGASVEYVLSMCPAIAQNFRDYSQKCKSAFKLWRRSLDGKRGGCGVRYGSRTIAWSNNTASYRLAKVERRFVENAQTYNFEVAQDHSYSLFGLASHNCKIAYDECLNCGHHAPSRADYCTAATCINPSTGYRGFGCREGLTKAADDGFMQGVDNPNPHWFDISGVTTHADRIAFGGVADYLKAAGVAAIGGAELAEQLLPPELICRIGETPEYLRQQRLLSKLAAIEQRLRSAPPTAKDQATLTGLKSAGLLMSDFGPFGGRQFGEALRALADCHAVLSLPDFVIWAGGEKSAMAVAEIQQAAPYSFTDLLFDPRMENWLQQNPFVPAENTTQKFARAAFRYADPFTEQGVKHAAVKSALAGNTPAQWSAGSRAVSENSQAVARQYALYKLAVLSQLSEREDFDELCRLAVLQNFVAP